MLYADIGKSIEKARSAKGMSKKQIAESLEMSPQNFHALSIQKNAKIHKVQQLSCVSGIRYRVL
jgi:ribosome-binding protein aMBF1 (putative translation factor)